MGWLLNQVIDIVLNRLSKFIVVVHTTYIVVVAIGETDDRRLVAFTVNYYDIVFFLYALLLCYIAFYYLENTF